jgi:hypothetical protein
MESVLQDENMRPMWEDMVATQEAADDYDIQEPGAMMGQKLRRTLTGIHVGHLTKKHGKTEKELGKANMKKPVYVSWSKDDKSMYLCMPTSAL